MKKVIGLGAVAMLVMALMAGGTWAYFSDYQSSTDNVLAAGTLDIGLSNASGNNTGGDTSGTWSLSNMAPGSSNQSTLYISNNGTITMSAVDVACSYTITGTSPVGTTVKATGNSTTNAIEKMIYVSAATWNSSPVAGLVGKSIYDLSTQNVTLGALGPNVQGALDLTWTFNTSATNGCQNQVLTANVTVYGQQ